MSFLSKEFALFIFYGGLAAIINFFTRFLFNEFMSFGFAVVCSYITAMLAAYVLMRNKVFQKTQKNVKTELSFFVLVNLFAIALSWAVSVSLAEYFFPKMELELYRYEIAHLCGIIVPAISSYFGHKNLTFR
jgi:putative flippase GtrA